MYPNLSWPLPPLHSLLALITRSVVTLVESAAGNSASELHATKLGSDNDVLGSFTGSIDAATCRMAGGCELQVVALFLGGFGLAD